jgi:hypothetical protein
MTDHSAPLCYPSRRTLEGLQFVQDIRGSGSYPIHVRTKESFHHVMHKLWTTEPMTLSAVLTASHCLLPVVYHEASLLYTRMSISVWGQYPGCDRKCRIARLVHKHGIIAVKCSGCLLGRGSSSSPSQQFPSHLRSDLCVPMRQQQVQ